MDIDCAGGGRCEMKSTGKGGDSEDPRHSPHLLPPGRPDANWPLFEAKYNYAPQDLGFRKGDLLYIISTKKGDWWYAQHKDNGDKGFVPSNYIAEYKSLDAEE